MYESELEDLFKQIFGVKKVSYALPGESEEQECLFVDIEKSDNVIKDGRAIARVTGHAKMFANAEKLPFGFFSKAIYRADSSLTKNFFFFDFESNILTFANIVQRGFGFVYFFDEQYDPEKGTITSVTIEVEES